MFFCLLEEPQKQWLFEEPQEEEETARVYEEPLFFAHTVFSCFKNGSETHCVSRRRRSSESFLFNKRCCFFRCFEEPLCCSETHRVLLKPQKEAAANTRAVLQRTPERFFSEHQSGSSKQRTPERQPSKEVQFQEEPQKKNRSLFEEWLLTVRFRRTPRTRRTPRRRCVSEAARVFLRFLKEETQREQWFVSEQPLCCSLLKKKNPKRRTASSLKHSVFFVFLFLVLLVLLLLDRSKKKHKGSFKKKKTRDHVVSC